ncbi:MAG: heat shock protein HspQ [Pseudomonadota bacterium]
MIRRIANTLLSRIIGPHPEFKIGQIVKSREHEVRGVVFKVDRRFSHKPAWLDAIPEERRPEKDQPFYWLYAENEIAYYETYVSEQSLLPDTSGLPVENPEIDAPFDGERYVFKRKVRLW